MPEEFKFSTDQIQQIENMINNVISTISGSDDLEMTIIDDNECIAVLTVCIDSNYVRSK